MNDGIVVAWDSDKTLIDVGGLTDKLLNGVFISNGYNPNEYLPKFRSPETEGRPIKERLIGIFGEIIGEDLYNQYKIAKNYGNQISPCYKGIKEMLEKVSLKAINIVVSNKDRKSINDDINGNNLCEYLEKIISSDDVGGDKNRLKPSPELLEIGIKGLDPELVIMIGDTANDVNSILRLNGNFSKIPILAGWGNSIETSEKQVERVEGQIGKDFYFVNKVDDLYEFLFNQVFPE